MFINNIVQQQCRHMFMGPEWTNQKVLIKINQNLKISNRLAGMWKFRYVGSINDHAMLCQTHDNECLVTRDQKLSTGKTLTTKAHV
jgi:hypothetical protein